MANTPEQTYPTASPSLSLEAIRERLDNSPVNEWEDHLTVYEAFIAEELERVSAPYRDTLMELAKVRKAQHEKRVRECQHDYERFCEFHNDFYFICRKCGHEK